MLVFAVGFMIGSLLGFLLLLYFAEPTALELREGASVSSGVTDRGVCTANDPVCGCTPGSCYEYNRMRDEDFDLRWVRVWLHGGGYEDLPESQFQEQFTIKLKPHHHAHWNKAPDDDR